MERLRGLWEGLPSWGKGGVLAGGGIGLGLLVWLLFWANARAHWTTLYSRLSPEDLERATLELGRAGIPYETQEAEGVLRVPMEKAAQARMALAQAGLPQSRGFHLPGFELLDRTPFGASDFLQRTNFLRALQGELARSIATLEPIASARVHLNLPQPTVFEERQPEPTASVVVALKPGAFLTPSQAKAIVFLVSRSIEGLRPENVVVVDTGGSILWAGGGGGQGLGEAGEHWQLRWETERRIEQRLQGLLDSTLGPGKGWVRVSVELDPEKKQSESEIYLPTSGGKTGLPVQESELTETYTAQGTPGAGGVAGTSSNLQLLPTSLPGLLGGTYTKRERKTEYQVSRRVERLEHWPGSIKRLSISLLVSQEVPSLQQQALQEAVAAAAGMDRSRGDTIVVTPIQVAKAAEEAPSPSAPPPSPLKRLGWLALPVVALLALGALLGRRRRVAPPPPEAGPPPSAFPSWERLHEIAQQEPQRLAALLRLWLREPAEGGGTNGRSAG